MITPPTDSLYKFIALFGLAILAWGLTFSAPLESDYRLKVAELDATTQAYAAQSKLKTNFADELEARQEDVGGDLAKWQKFEDEKTALRLEIIKMSGDLTVQEYKLRALREELEWSRLLGLLARWGGALLAIAGFVLWYLKIQVHIDRKAADGGEL